MILFMPDAQKIVMSSLLTFIYMHDIVDGFSMCMFLRIYMYNPIQEAILPKIGHNIYTVHDIDFHIYA